MKRIYIITILAVICGLTAMAQNNPDIAHQTTGRDRGGFALGSVPIITYHEASQTLTVHGSVLTTYFELTIKTMITQEIKFQEMFEGASATIDVSDLEDGETYQIVFVDSRNTNFVTMFEKTASWTSEPGIIGVKTDPANSLNGLDNLNHNIKGK